MNWKTIAPRLYLPLLLLLCVAYAWRPLEGGFDFWAHAAIGKWIWANERVPREALFLWSQPSTPWVAHSWLSQLLFYGMLEQGGPRLVVVFNAFTVAFVFWLLWRLWKQEAKLTFWAPLIFALAIWVSAPRFQPRQELLSALFLVMLLAFLIAWQNGRFDDWLRDKGLIDASLIAVPLITLFFLWVNLHALVAVGLLILWMAVLADGAQALLGSNRYDAPARTRARVLLAIGVLCAAATLLNPYGLAYWSAADQLRPGGQAQFIEEWRPLLQAPALWTYFAVELFLFGCALITWLANPQRQWSHFLWLLLAGALTLRSRRMLFLAAIIFVVIVAANVRYLDTPTIWRRWRRLTGGDEYEPLPAGLRLLAQAGVVATLVVWLLAAASRHTDGDAGRWSTFVRDVPESAARFLAGKPRQWRVLADYEDASYLQWRLNGAPEGKPGKFGRLPLYVDLLNAYPDAFMEEYLQVLNAEPQGLKRLESRKVNCVVLGDHHFDKALVTYLNDHDNWQQVLSDQQSKIWLRLK